jgi:hypothetical protein
MNRDLVAFLTGEDHRSLVALGRAIAMARRNDWIRVWRAFVMTRVA